MVATQISVWVAVTASGRQYQAATERELHEEVEATEPRRYDAAQVFSFTASLPAQRVAPVSAVTTAAQEKAAETLALKKLWRSRVVRMPSLDAMNFDAAQAEYKRELAQFGWGHAETEWDERVLAEWALAYGDEVAKLVNNYQTGIITGGELDMKLAEFRGIIK